MIDATPPVVRRPQIDVLDALGRLLHGESVRDVAARYGVQQTSLRAAIRLARRAAATRPGLEARALTRCRIKAARAQGQSASGTAGSSPSGASRLTAAT